MLTSTQIIKKILNINLDRNSNNSAATVGMVKKLAPHTVNNLYRNYFEVFDFTDANNYGLSRSSSGIVFNSLILLLVILQEILVCLIEP